LFSLLFKFKNFVFAIHTYVIKYFALYIAPPAINNLTATEICINDFTVSWTPGNGDTDVLYDVRRSSLIVGQQTMNTSFNFTSLTPNTDYMVNVISVSSGCSGIPKRINVTKSTREAGVPRSELALLHTLIAIHQNTYTEEN